MNSSNLIKFVKNTCNQWGIDINRYPSSLPPDFESDVREIIDQVKKFTMTSPERVAALCQAVKYISSNKIAGEVVECGVWKGGSMMVVAQTLLNLNDTTRHLYLFDTFDGMPQPTKEDVDLEGIEAEKLLKINDKKVQDSIWCYAALEEVKKNLNTINYPSEKIHYIQGKVEETIPENSPETIALLRLDTDWYESTRHELIHLFPRLSHGSVIIIDDYGHWQGARKAVDEYLKDNNIPLLLNRIDVTGRIGIITKM